MFKKACLYLLFVIFVILPNHVSAEWLRYAGNPLTFNKNYSDWNEHNKLQLSVIHDEGLFKMWYTSYKDDQNQKIGYAASVDGYSWEDSGPVFAVNGVPIHDPTVIKETDSYTMWFSGDFPNPGSWRKMKIMRAVSQNGKDWTLSPETPVLDNVDYTWEHFWLTAPFVLKEDGIYKMWYSGHDGNNFKIGYAISANGITWEKYSKNPIIDGADGPYITKENGEYQMYYQRGGPGCDSGIKKSTSTNGTLWENPEFIICKRELYEHNNISPNVILYNNVHYLFYNGLFDLDPTNHKSSINLAFDALPQEKFPIIIIPGFLASWNSKAILHNETTPPEDWRLAGFVNEYGGLIQTLKNLGLNEGSDLFVFGYDWRKPIEEIVKDFDNYLKNIVWLKNSMQKTIIVGHSLGGLIGRIYAQKYPDSVIKIVSVGSPHKGVVQSYLPWISGEIPRENSLFWLAKKIILNLNRKNNESDKKIIQTNFPIIKDLIPDFDFLRDQNQTLLDHETISIRNGYLASLNQDLSNVSNKLSLIYGKGNKQTLSGLEIDTNNKGVDYPDGKPINNFFDFGDGTVVDKSSLIRDDANELNFNHGELIYKKEAIAKILDLINLKYTEGQIIEGEATVVSPSLIFLIQSPIKLTVEVDNQTYSDQDGLIYIKNPKSGKYLLKALGTAQGNYSILVGQITEENDLWEKLSGTINNNPASSQLDEYNFSYSPKKAETIFYTKPINTPIPTNINNSNYINNQTTSEDKQEAQSKKTQENNFFTNDLKKWTTFLSQNKKNLNKKILGKTISKNSLFLSKKENRLFQLFLFSFLITLILIFIKFRKTVFRKLIALFYRLTNSSLLPFLKWFPKKK